MSRRQKRHRRPTHQKGVMGLVILAVIIVLLIIGGILWLLNSPRFLGIH